MSNCNGTQQISPSLQKEQSECQLVSDKNKRNPKKKL